MRVTLWDISKVQPYAANPRRNEQAVAAVAASIREFGFRQPIVVDGAGVIVVGDTRYKAARQLGLKQVPVHVATDLSAAQIKAYRIADNKTGELAEWDHDRLVAELAELEQQAFNLEPLGFSADELQALSLIHI
jgi:ParB-like chromosome segregation protein Spo0J